MQRAQLTEFVLKLDREAQRLRDQSRSSEESKALTVVQSDPKKSCRAQSWRTISYGTVFVGSLLLVAMTWMRPDLNGQATRDWKRVLALAEAARERGELYDAKSLYSQTGQLATWGKDWAGLLAAACGMEKIDRERGGYSATHALLLRAMTTAETKQSKSGMAAVANAFEALGQDRVASITRSRIRRDWVEATNDPVDAVSPNCWNR